MARTTEEKKDKHIDLRISQRLYDEIAKRGKVGTVIREIVEESLERDKVGKNGVAVGSGKVAGKVAGKTAEKPEQSEVDISEFVEWCHNRQVIPQIVFNNIMKEIHKTFDNK